MNKKTSASQILFKTFAVAMIMIACWAMVMIPDYQSNAATSKTVRVTIGKADTVDLPGNVADILVADPAIADVGALRANRIYVVGKGLGDTNILAFDDVGGLVADVSVHVRVDESTLRNSIREFFPNEKNITVRTVNDDIVLGGHVTTPAAANLVRDLASRFVREQGQSVVDLMTVKGEQQVMLKVKVLEVNRTVLREYGVEPDYRPGGTGGVFNTSNGIGQIATVPFATGSLFWDDNGKFGPLKVSLQALEEEGLVNTLAEPNLTAISGETAGFLAGGEFPVPVAQDQDGKITIEFKQYGVSLNFTPRVMSRERISLLLSTEVSSLDEQNSVTLADLEVPGLAVRRAQTTVEMGSGGTIMIAGLIKSETNNAQNGMPGLQDLPVLGELFKSKSFQRDESELLIMVTPYIVSPFAEADAELVDSAASPMNTASASAAMPDAMPKMRPLATTFVDTLGKVYGDKVPSVRPYGEQTFGYMVD